MMMNRWPHESLVYIILRASDAIQMKKNKNKYCILVDDNVIVSDYFGFISSFLALNHSHHLMFLSFVFLLLFKTLIKNNDVSRQMYLNLYLVSNLLTQPASFHD